MDPKIVKKTQDSLGKIIKKPPLTEKLLGKPPFRFLHDVVTSVIKTTGFMKGLYEDAELNSENVKEKEGKIAFLQKAIDMVVAATGSSVAAKPAKIVAGHEPERTNEFLQMLAAAIEANPDNDQCVKKVLSGAAGGGGGGDSKKEEKREKDKERTRSASRKKDDGDKHKKDDKEKSQDREKDKKHRDRSEGRDDKERHRDRRDKSRDREDRHKDKDRERRKKPTDEKRTGEVEKEKQTCKTAQKPSPAEPQITGFSTEGATTTAQVKSLTDRKTEWVDKSEVASSSGSGIGPTKDRKEVGVKRHGGVKKVSGTVKESNTSPQKTQAKTSSTQGSTSPDKVKMLGNTRNIPRALKGSEKSSSASSSPQKSPEKKTPDGPSRSSASGSNPDQRGLAPQRGVNRQDGSRYTNSIKQPAASLTKQTSSPSLRIGANSRTPPKKPLKTAVSSSVLAAKQPVNKRHEQVKATASQGHNKVRPGQPPGQPSSKISSHPFENSTSAVRVPDSSLEKNISAWTAGGKERGAGEEAVVSNIQSTAEPVAATTAQEDLVVSGRVQETGVTSDCQPHPQSGVEVPELSPAVGQENSVESSAVGQESTVLPSAVIHEKAVSQSVSRQSVLQTPAPERQEIFMGGSGGSGGGGGGRGQGSGSSSAQTADSAPQVDRDKKHSVSSKGPATASGTSASEQWPGDTREARKGVKVKPSLSHFDLPSEAGVVLCPSTNSLDNVKEVEEKENESPEQNGEKDSQEAPSKLQRPTSAKGSRRRRQGREARDDDDEEFQQKEREQPAISEHDLPPQVTAARKMARPPSARPAPPRPKQEGVDQEPAMRLGTGAPTNLIVDDGKQSDDEDENFLVEESAPPPPTTFNDTAATQGDAEDDAEHGALVKKMLESKKDAEQQQQQPTKKTEIERPALSDAQRRKQRELVAKEIERLQTSIQSLTRSANPLGKIMDYVQEDMDSMQKELDRWRTENKEHALALRREKNVTDRAIEPLKVQLAEIDRAISDQLDLIAACKSNIIRNDQRTQKMLQSIARS